jgi:hypothetical protein
VCVTVGKVTCVQKRSMHSKIRNGLTIDFILIAVKSVISGHPVDPKLVAV